MTLISTVKQTILDRFKDKSADVEVVLASVVSNGKITTQNDYMVILKESFITQELLNYVSRFSVDDLTITLQDGKMQFGKSNELDFFILNFEVKKTCEV